MRYELVGMGVCKLATLQHLFKPPLYHPLHPPHCLMLQAEEGVYLNALLSKCCVYIAEGEPLPLQISRSKRGKHSYINKRSSELAPVTHLGFSHMSELRGAFILYWR